MARKVTLITIGKLRDSSLKKIEHEYLKRLKQIQIEIIELKSFQTQPIKEEEQVLKLLEKLKAKNQLQLVLFHEAGQQFTSPEFSKTLFQKLSRPDTNLVLLITGSHGHGKTIENMASEVWSLSNLTFPHQLARILLIEQIYRAETLYYNHPYHH